VHPGARLAPALAALLVSAPNQSGPGGTPLPPPPAQWTSLQPGLDLGIFPGPPGAPGDGKIWIVRVDPSRFELRLANASAGDARPHTVRAWAVALGAVVAINAGMYQTDGLTSVGLMQTRSHRNNPRLSSRLKSVLAFDPRRPGLAPVRILDAACGELATVPPDYGTLIQSVRMVSCDRRNVWAADGRRWSTAAVGVDGNGRALLVHARSPWQVHDLVEALLSLPIDLRRAMYLEGGPVAQLFVRAGGREIERLGAFEGAAQKAGAGLAWEIPNAVVVVPRR